MTYCVSSYDFIFKGLHHIGEWKYGYKNKNFLYATNNIYNNFYFIHLHRCFVKNLNNKRIYFLNGGDMSINCKLHLEPLAVGEIYFSAKHRLKNENKTFSNIERFWIRCSISIYLCMFKTKKKL